MESTLIFISDIDCTRVCGIGAIASRKGTNNIPTTENVIKSIEAHTQINDQIKFKQIK